MSPSLASALPRTASHNHHYPWYTSENKRRKKPRWQLPIRNLFAEQLQNNDFDPQFYFASYSRQGLGLILIKTFERVENKT